MIVLGGGQEDYEINTGGRTLINDRRRTGTFSSCHVTQHPSWGVHCPCHESKMACRRVRKALTACTLIRTNCFCTVPNYSHEFPLQKIVLIIRHDPSHAGSGDCYQSMGMFRQVQPFKNVQADGDDFLDFLQTFPDQYALSVVPRSCFEKYDVEG